MKSPHATTMTPDGMNYQREGIQVPYVTQHPAWTDASGFVTHGHPHPGMHFAPHSPHEDATKQPMSFDLAWSGYRPNSQGQPMHMVQQGHNPFCHQHGKPEGEPTMPGHACGCPHHQPSTIVPPAVPTPPPSDSSPHPGWMPVMNVDSEHAAKRMKFDWNFDNNTPVLRPDGVRKKNAKFEIPEDRNLDTLDTLIKHAKSETELKELKMQKRLLRNREAALHSRQKKKSHTEWLERERDDLWTKLNSLQQICTDLKIRIDDHDRDKAGWQDQIAQSEQKVNSLQREKAMMADKHARETKSMQMELERLREQLGHSQETSPASTNPASATFSEDSVNFSNGSNFGHDWDGIYEFGDGCLDPGKLRHSGDPGGPSIMAH